MAEARTRTSNEARNRLRAFIDHEATGGLVLTLAAAAAILFVNFGLNEQYHAILEQTVSIGVGEATFQKSLHHFINDGLMAIFFFLVGLEIKRESVEGNLATLSQIVLPAVAALGGILVPSGIYALINWSDPATIHGWAIPSATDIAFALGALALAGPRVPLGLKVFLLTLATFDDLAAIIIIALFYSGALSTFALLGSAACLAALFALNRFGVTRTTPYILLGLVLWSFVLKSGVHATLAGVALGLLIPMRRRDGTSPVHELEETLHSYVKFLILPLFAFANAGLPLNGFSWANLSDHVPSGIILGLVVGKPVGIMLATFLLVVTGLAALPKGSTWRQMFGVSCLAGIGFTMSLFIGTLAFPDALHTEQVRVGVIAGSLISVLLGLAVLLPGRTPKA
ncbi:MAG: Na+/H+ antiporter NhaA [Proteobacteria bacterium]|nr:Na+/H+ antiporter NhaA [Pseudomonadota bacterium]